MTNKIEEIMALGIREHRLGPKLSKSLPCDKESVSWQSAVGDMRAALTALDNAGLAVVPKDEGAIGGEGYGPPCTCKWKTIRTSGGLGQRLEAQDPGCPIHGVIDEDFNREQNARLHDSAPTDPDINGGPFPQEAKA